MNKNRLETQVEAELNHYFESARAQKCPNTMKKSLYRKISSKNTNLWFKPRLLAVGLSLVLVVSVVFNLNHENNLSIEIPSTRLQQAQTDLQIAMYYLNQVSLKSLTEVNNKGIKPALIRPLAVSMASL